MNIANCRVAIRASILLALTIICACCGGKDERIPANVRFLEGMTMRLSSRSNENILQAPQRVTDLFAVCLNMADAKIVNIKHQVHPVPYCNIYVDHYEFIIIAPTSTDYIYQTIDDNTMRVFKHDNIAILRELMLSALEDENGFTSDKVLKLIDNIEGNVRASNSALQQNADNQPNCSKPNDETE